ncbi:hypothetical protein [Glutamicibacter sp. TV12E]|uniref:hypothetical protein n=1 Tax=Glutamicibacter sp. TV12E TaxID=3446362 RepID=UPI0040334489
MQKGKEMRVIDPDGTHLPDRTHRDAVCQFLEANGIDPEDIASRPMVYDGRALRVRADYVPRIDGLLIPDRSQHGYVIIPIWYKVHREATPRRYGI